MSTSRPGWRAYVDESMPCTRPGKTPSYIIAAALLDSGDCADARWAISALAGKRPRFHWKDAKPELRREAVEVVSGLPALHLLIVAAPLDIRRQERARSIALQRTFYELNQRGVSHAYLESRTERLNRRDMRTVDAAMITGTMNARTQVSHALPEDEPLLWIPDIVAGAFGSSECPAIRLRDLIEVVRIENR